MLSGVSLDSNHRLLISNTRVKKMAVIEKERRKVIKKKNCKTEMSRPGLRKQSRAT